MALLHISTSLADAALMSGFVIFLEILQITFWVGLSNLQRKGKHRQNSQGSTKEKSCSSPWRAQRGLCRHKPCACWVTGGCGLVRCTSGGRCGQLRPESEAVTQCGVDYTRAALLGCISPSCSANAPPPHYAVGQSLGSDMSKH